MPENFTMQEDPGGKHALAKRIQALVHAQNCVLWQNAKSAHELDVAAIHELDAIIDQLHAEVRR